MSAELVLQPDPAPPADRAAPAAPAAPAPATDRDDERERIIRAESLVRQHAQRAMAVGLVPIPLVDVAASSALQLRLLKDLATLYEVDFSAQRGKAAIAALAGGASSALASIGVRRLAPKLIGIPLFLACAASTAVFAGASTFAIGRVFVQHFDSGGTFLTFDPERVRDFYAEAFAQGREEAHMSFAGIKP